MASILVVEDSTAQLGRIVALLRAAGHVVIAAMDWSECREILRSTIPALILMDVNLAGSQGGDILALQLKKHPTMRKIRVIFHSASKEADLRVMVKRSGADGFIIKGKPDEQFLAELQSFLAVSAT